MNFKKRIYNGKTLYTKENKITLTQLTEEVLQFLNKQCPSDLAFGSRNDTAVRTLKQLRFSELEAARKSKLNGIDVLNGLGVGDKFIVRWDTFEIIDDNKVPAMPVPTHDRVQTGNEVISIPFKQITYELGMFLSSKVPPAVGDDAEHPTMGGQIVKLKFSELEAARANRLPGIDVLDKFGVGTRFRAVGEVFEIVNE